MTIVTEVENGLFLTCGATIIDTTKDVAAASEWAAQYVSYNPNYKWILGKYVEADSANSNGQYWEYEDLRLSQPTIDNSPMNMNHNEDEIVGTWTKTEMILPTEAASEINPYIESLGVFWKWYFPEHLSNVEKAYKSGQLFISMETVAESVTCVGGDHACGATFPYEGPMSKNYCQHIQDRETARQLNKSQFLAGALIIPPNRPGWKNAEVKEISKKTSDEQKHQILKDIAISAPHLNPSDWENIMWSIQMENLKKKIV